MNGIVDSGAVVNVMPFSVYEMMEFKPKMDKFNSDFYGYGSKKAMEIVGQFTCEVRCGTKIIQAGFVVSQDGQECLWDKKLGSGINYFAGN